MSKALALALVLVLLASSLIVAVKPVSAAIPAENSWTTKAPMSIARSSLGVAEANGKIYAIGGSSENEVTSTNEEYDPITNSWINKQPMPIPMDYFATAVYQNKVYCIGEKVNEVYNPTTDTWETKTAMPTPRTGVQAKVANNRIYVIGGYVQANYTTQNFTNSFLALNEAYDPETDTWTTRTPIPIATATYASSVVDNKIYILGGLSKSGDGKMNQIYDSETDTWRQGAPAPSTIAYAQACSTSGMNAPKRIYMLTQDFSSPEEPYNQPIINLVYDPGQDTWMTGTALPTTRRDFGFNVANDILYVIGGVTETFDLFGKSHIKFYTANEQYTPFGYGTVSPVIVLVSPENKTYPSGNLSLTFTVNQPASWIGYSLDGQNNVTVTDNTTITELANGLHNITVYAKDEFDNIGASETITFNLKEPFPTTFVATASIVTLVAVGIGLLVYLKKRRH